MYYRLAIQQGRDHLDRPVTWQWKSTALSSLQSLFQLLRLYGALLQEHLRVFSSPSREGLEEQQEEENKMKKIVIRQAVVVSILGVLLCVALLLGVLLLLASIAGTHPSQTGIMLIASPSHLA